MKAAWPFGAAAAASALLIGAAQAQEVPAAALSAPDAVVSAGVVSPEGGAFAAPESEALGPTTDTAGAAAAWQEDSPWRFSVTPYVFLPAVEGQLRFNPPPATDGAPRVTIDASDILDALEFAFMISADAHYGRFGVMTDVLYVDLETENTRVDQIIRPGGVIDIPVDLDSSVGFQSWLWTGAFGVEFGEPGDLTIEPFLGFRYMRAEADLDWSLQGPIGAFPQSGSLSTERDGWDGIAGVRGLVSLGEDSRWKVTYYADVGTGDSELTWQVIGSIGYSYGWGDLRFAWRHIAYDQGDDAFLQDFSLTGPAFGATIRF